MQREIKFRGIRKGTTNEWLYGDLSHVNGDTFIFPIDGMNSPDYYEVIPETVGQYVGQKCYHSEDDFKELYEGDKVLTINGVMTCVWNNDQCRFQLENNNVGIGFHNIDISTQPIIGNIHDKTTGNRRNRTKEKGLIFILR